MQQMLEEGAWTEFGHACGLGYLHTEPEVGREEDRPLLGPSYALLLGSCTIYTCFQRVFPGLLRAWCLAHPLLSSCPVSLL